jgi:carboxypeptidase family protein
VHKCFAWASAAALALLLAGPTARAQQANYSLPKEPTATVGATNYYAVPIGYTWDHFAYQSNTGDWNVAIGDTGFDAGEIPGNPTFCGANGDKCTADAGGPKSTAFITINNDTLHGFTGIPILIGPTQDGFNNAQIGFGQSIPVVPGHYKAVYVAYTGVCGPQQKMLSLNYADSSVVSSVKWADWCAPSQSPPDFFTWAPTHRLGANGIDNNSCALITKYFPADPNRTLTSITVGKDSTSDGGIQLPGDTITSNCHRLVIGGITLASADATLGSYGFVSGHLMDSSGKALTTPAHTAAPDTGYDVFVLSPDLGNYGAGANVDGSYTIGLPAGTYMLSAAVRGGSASTSSAGPQATPVMVKVTAGQTTAQDITILASPMPSLWGELNGTVKDASGNAVMGATLLVSDSATGPFAGVAIPQDWGNGPPAMDGTTLADGKYDLQGLDASHPIFVKAAGNGFASASATMVTLTGGKATTQDITVAPVAEGNIAGTVLTPDSQFGGIGVPVTLSSRTLTLTTTTIALPPLAGTGRVPETGETATFEFSGVPAGDYMLTLPASAVQGAAAATPVTIKAGQTATPTLTLAYPAWSEGTADPKISDPLSGTALDAKWTAADIGMPGAKGSVAAASTGLTVMADGTGWDANTVDDAFHYVYQTIPAGDWVAYVTVTAVPTAGTSGSSGTTIAPGGQAGLMVASAVAAAPRMANFVISDTNMEGVAAQSRLADGTTTFPFGETAANTDTSNGGKQPGLPLILKLRKVGANLAGFYSTDGGKTQFLIGNTAPQFDPTASLLLGLATTSNTDGTLDKATYQNFVFAPLAAPAPAAGQ